MHGGKNRDTPIGQFVLIGNFRRRLARELLYNFSKKNPFRKLFWKICVLNSVFRCFGLFWYFSEPLEHVSGLNTEASTASLSDEKHTILCRCVFFPGEEKT